MNALYVNRRGQLLDPTGHGIKDAKERRIRFVGDGTERCREDYLRILRAFRFTAKYGTGLLTGDVAHAIAPTIPGLKCVSEERILAELKKIVVSPGAHGAFHQMKEMGVFGFIGLSVNRIDWLNTLRRAEEQYGFKTDWRIALTPMLQRIEELENLPLSKSDRKAINSIWNYTTSDLCDLSGRSLGFKFKDHFTAVAAYLIGVALGYRSFNHNEINDIEIGVNAKLPVTSEDFRNRGIENGPMMGACIMMAKKEYYNSDLRLTSAHIIDNVMSQLLAESPSCG
jgi:poly(A) polymerase